MSLSRALLEAYLRRFEVTRPQTFIGSLSQMAAGLTHHVTPAKLREISKNIPKILILTGDEDNLVDPGNSFYLKEHMPEAEFVQWEQTGHSLQIQQKKRLNSLIERVVDEGRAKV